ncbi:MAG: M48 family metalloprotease, partial [Candidatus Riflebacteria bacterium]|nr:M48 family metalloprotease [Candidatus Riflebacteria bacterium]
LGHVVHWDMLVMTASSLVPMILYCIYDVCWRFSSGKDSKNNPFPVIALTAYICYVIAEYLVLFLSRVREYYADRYAAETTRNPSLLSAALVKIAYGLVTAEAVQRNQAKQAKEAGQAAAGSAIGTGAISALGIFDARSAKGLLAASNFSTREQSEALLGAMQWDLWNPWALYHELHSTHPLPAKRLDHLGRLAFSHGQKPFVLFDREQPESYWDEFLVDVAVVFLPLVLPLAAMALGAALGLRGEQIGGLFLMGLGLGVLLKTWYSYPGGYMPYSVSALLSHVKVSQVRAVPARLEGVGKGVPGLVWGEDLVIRDRTGMVMLDYAQPLAIFEWIFGLGKARKLQGKRVKATGWYRRSPVPYVELSTLQEEGSPDVSTCYVAVAKQICGAMLAAAGLVLFFV